MKIYTCIKTDYPEKSLIKIGQKFIIFNKILYPINATNNTVGIDLYELEMVDKNGDLNLCFYQHFQHTEDKSAEYIPIIRFFKDLLIKQQLKTTQEYIADMKLINDDLQQIMELI